MKTRILLIASLLSLSSCATVDFTDDCPGSVGSTVTNLFYGDSQIRMTPVSRVKPNSVFRIKLKPQRGGRDPVDYDSVVVEVTPKPPTVGAWLVDSGSYDSTAGDNNELRFCVPDDPDRTIYWFNVDIQPEIGKLDPRAEVVR